MSVEFVRTAGSTSLLDLPQLLRDRTDRSPSASAFFGPWRTPITYGALRRQVEDVADTLNVLGIGRNDRVAVVLSESPHTAMATLAIACASTCAPIHPDYCASEYNRYFTELNPKALLIAQGSASEAKDVAFASGIPVLELAVDDAEAGLFSITGEALRAPVQRGLARPGDVALVLYTSGTTGRQKLVSLTHGNICFSAASICDALQLADSDRCLGVMPLFHIHGLSAVFASLAAGASFICRSKFTPAGFFEDLRKFQPTWYTAAPAIHRAILEHTKHEFESTPRSSLRFIRSASSSMPRQLSMDIEQTFGVPVIEAYGMTEASPQIATNRLPPFPRKPGSVGRPAGPEVAIMDEAGNHKPPGETGEIVIRGSNVSRAFENDGSLLTNGWLRTGDVGYRDAEGYLFVTGRQKEVINRGGEKISPREVDEALMDHPAVAEAVSFAVPHPALGESVGAAAVLRDKTAATEAELRRFVATRLAPFKVPGLIAIVPEIPKSPGGKVQRIGLAQRLGLVTASDARADERAHTAPRTPIEEKLLRIFAEVLNVERLGIQDNFFHLGGDSLMTMQVGSRVWSKFGISLPVDMLFHRPTVSELAEFVSTALSQGGAVPEEPGVPKLIPRRSMAEPCPLSFAQQRLWFLDQLQPGNPAYHMHVALRIGGPLDMTILGRSLTEILLRHESLRTTFHSTDKEPVQRIHPARHLHLPVIDLCTIPSAAQDAEVKRLDAEIRNQPFNLARGPLFRAAILKLGADEHVLLLTMHHIVFDGWSMGVLYRELSVVYASLLDGSTIALPALPIQFADYAIWQRQCQMSRIESDLEYWKVQLGESPPALALPLDRSRPPIQTYSGARLRRSISSRLKNDLKSVGQLEDATPFMVFLAAFQTLLMRYSGQEDILVGTPVACRNRLETESLIGFFANTLVMRGDLSGDPTFRELLRRVRATALEVFRHQDVPFEMLVEQLLPERNFSQPPLFQVMFAFQNVPATVPALGPGFDVQPMETESDAAKFDLTLYLSETDGFAATWQYNTDLFDAVTIERMATRFEVLLAGITADPDRRLSELPLLTCSDQGQLSETWNTDLEVRNSGRCFHHLFQEQVQRAPHAVAVQCGDRRLTYEELNRHAERLALRLQSMGIQPDMLIGVCLTRSVNAAIALLGVLKAGCVYVPLDPGYPAERLAFMLEDADVPLLITEFRLQDKLPTYHGTALLVETAQEMDANQPATDFIDRTLPGNRAYVIYTSGSTERPRGVIVTHANVFEYIVALRETLAISSEDRWLHTASFGFSSSIRQFLVPLSCGATVVIATSEQIHDPWAMFEHVRKDGVSIIDLVPSHLRICAQALMGVDEETRRRLVQNRLRLTLSASEPLLSDTSRDWQRLFGRRVQMVNMFGQTETTGIVTTYPVTAVDDGAVCVPIGRPLANSRIYLLDAYRRPVPAGVAGEIYVGGGSVASGYLNQPELTAERFIPNPFDSSGSSRLYRTGDLGRYRSDNNLEFLGRTDHQIKVRGFRIEPGEIQAVLGQHALVKECAVVVATGANGPRLVAHVATTRHAAELSAELRQYLKARLPHYMVPAAFIKLDKLPRTSNGKVDRRALAAQSATKEVANLRVPDGDGGVISPTTSTETTLSKIWCDVLGLERVGVHDNFFDLGGDSLLTTSVVQRASEAGLRLRITQIFQYPTIAQLAQTISRKQPGSAQLESKRVFRITADSLRAYGCEALEKAGMSAEGASIVTETQLEASLRSQPTHNIGSIPRYARRNASGRTNPRPEFRIERETAISALVDGDNGQGQWVAVWAMQLAIRKAKENGIGLVGARRSNHFGAAGHYAWLAAKENLIGLCTTNAGVWLAPTGGLTPTFGNNPLGVGIPAQRHFPIIMDISMSVAAKGKIGLHLADGNPLPLGWIFDRLGRLSVDPSDLAAGLGVPIGGHKGYGLTLVLETLAGILTGADFCRDHRRERMRKGPPDLGHFFLCIDPGLFMHIDEFTSRVDRMVEQTKSSERMEDVAEIFLPGEMEMQARAENIVEGVPILPGTFSALEKYRRAAGLKTTLEFAK